MDGNSLLPVEPLPPAEFLWLIGSVCTLFRIPFDARLVQNEYPPPLTRTSLEAALRALGFRTHRVGDPALAAASSLPLPAIAFPPANTPPLTDGAAPRALLLVKADAERILFFEAGSDAPQTVSAKEAAQRFGEVLLLSREATETAAAAAADPDGLPRAARFGFGWFVPELLKHRAVWRDVLIASLVIQLIGLTTPLFTQVIIDKVVVHQTRSTLLIVAFGLIGFMLFGSVMTWLRQYLVIHTGNRIDAVLGSNVFRQLLRLPLPFFEQRATGVLVARMQGVDTVREFVTGAAVALVLDLPFLLIFLGVMFWYSWQLTLIALAAITLITLLSAVVTPVFRRRLDRQFQIGARNTAFITEYVGRIETVKSLQLEPQLEKRYGDSLAGYLSAGFSTRTLGNTYSVVSNALEQTMTLSILIAGALLVMRNDGFTIGTLVAFQMFASRMSQPMLRLVALWQEFQQASIAIQRLGDIMNVPTEPYALTPARVHTAAVGVEFRDVSFRYGPERPWLFRNLDVSMPPGRLTLLIGPSGSGKSTLTKLLLGFYAPTEGQIRVGGSDLRHLSANELRGFFGVVPQETQLFSGSLYDNLLAAQPAAAFDEVVSACRFAGIHDFIQQQLPQGYQTVVGENGVGLSGGQRQRIAIARALLKKPKVLIFDEATSGLDAETAEAIAQTINGLRGTITILFITHHRPEGLRVDETLNLMSAR